MKVVIVGGVAAGMSCAARTRRLDEDADIVVFERDEHVSFANCGLPYHVGEVIEDREALLLQTPQSLRASLDLDVRVGTEIVDIDPVARTVTARRRGVDETYLEDYDHLVLTPGAQPFRLPVPGIDHPRVHVLRSIADMDRLKAQVDGDPMAGVRPARNAVVIGAGYIGLETAENLHHRGVEVTLVEQAHQVMPPLDREMTAAVEQHLRDHGIGLRLGARATRFAEAADGHLLVDLDDETRLAADLVLVAAGVRPNTELALAAGVELGPRGGILVDEHLRTSVPGIWAAGDAIEGPHAVLPGTWVIPLAGPANRQGRVVADNLCGRPTTMPATQGTGIVKVFDLVAGATGANQRQLEDAGIAFERIHLHPSGHAGYYPGTQAMHLKVLFAPGTGRLLGASIVGVDGVDKRLDVLATAIRFGATIEDLQELELAYAPPFGSAKDPVNMAGFIGTNLLRGDVELWYADDYPAAVEGARVIDVRDPEEHALWHVPDAENVPLRTLRKASTDWDRDTPLRLYCAVGFRSYLAYRLLVQRGFTDVRTLSGGTNTFRATMAVEPHPSLDIRQPVVSYAEEHTAPRRRPSTSEAARR